MDNHPVYTRNEVSRHNKSSALWLIIDKDVYDLTDFQAEHPGKDRLLRKTAGKDTSKEFHESHSASILERYKKRLCIGGVETERPETPEKTGLWGMLFG